MNDAAMLAMALELLKRANEVNEQAIAQNVVLAAQNEWLWAKAEALHAENLHLMELAQHNMQMIYEN